ncbi:MAG: hypothetical protein L3J22_03830 [Xanthomonadales bacterium]|nr:hypothetical protein [Xanthomonadales bacterium]
MESKPNEQITYAGLMLVAFVTPFGVAAGTGGYPQAASYYTTGNSSFVIVSAPLDFQSPDQVELNAFFGRVNDLFETYGLGKDQLAHILAVSRPTVYSWLDKQPKRVSDKHMDRVMCLQQVLNDFIPAHLRVYLGGFLRHKLNLESSKLMDNLSEKELAIEVVKSSLVSVEFGLEGMLRSAKLSSALADKAPYT